MRVAVVTQYFPTSQQVWAGHSAYQTLRCLAPLCEDLHVFYPEATYPPLLAPAAAKRAAIDRRWSPAGVAATYLPYLTLPVIGRARNGASIARRLREPIRAWGPDVILNYVMYPDGLGATRIGRALGVPVVLTAIGSDLNRIPGEAVRTLTQEALREATIVTTVSHDLARTAVSLGADAERTRAILNGCDTSVFHPGTPDAEARAEARAALQVPQDAEAIVYVGRLDVRKGLIELVEAVAGLRAERPRVRCYVMGDGPDRQAVVDAMARTGTGDAMTLVPSTATAGVARWMSAADLVTLPSYKEGCPNVVIEALAAGRPVVASDVGGIPELMDESCGRLVPAQDAAALRRALAETLERSWDAQSIAARHNRSWADVARDVYQVLESAIRMTQDVE